MFFPFILYIFFNLDFGVSLSSLHQNVLLSFIFDGYFVTFMCQPQYD